MEQTEATTQKTDIARLRYGGGGRRRALWILTAAVLALAAGYAALCVYALHTASIWRDTRVLGQDIGGLTAEQAVRAVERALPSLEISVCLYDRDRETVHLSAEPDGAIALADLDASIDVESLVEEADREARRGPFLTAGWRYLFHGGLSWGGGPETVSVDPDDARAAAQALAQRLSLPVEDTAYTLEEDGVVVRLARDGRTVDAQALEDGLRKGTWTQGLALLIPCRTQSGRTMTAQEIYDAVAGEMQNAGYDSATDTITPERTGVEFDVSDAQSRLDAAAPGETVTLPARVQFPTVTAEELRRVLFRDVLGEASTWVGGTAARIENVKLAAAAVDGTVLASGGVFSYNETVGQRTAAKGYKPAPAYVQGQTVDEIGGGVCQPSSTLYLACLLADLEIVQRQAHRYLPSYIEPGMDATVSWGGPDYRFANDTDYPIRISAVYDKGLLTMKILGTKTDGVTVKMTGERLSTTPYETVYVDDPTLAPGEERVQVTPYAGARYRTYRCRYDGDGDLISRTVEAVSDYKSRDRVIARGPAASAPQTDLPGGTADPGQTEGPGGAIDPSGGTEAPGGTEGPGGTEAPGETVDPGQAEGPIFVPEDEGEYFE